jgi:LysM repeat protein
MSVPAVPREAIQPLVASGVLPRSAAAGLPKPAPAPAVVAGSHTVEAGESLWSISRRYGVSLETLASVNGVTLTSILQPGQALIIPAGPGAVAVRPSPATEQPTPASRPASGPAARPTATAGRTAARPTATAGRAAARPTATRIHVVRDGDTLWDIARQYGARVEDLTALNDLGDSDWIKPGQRLVISGSALPRHRQVSARTRGSQAVMADAASLRVAGTFFWPARGVLTSRFGWRYRRHHEGIDLAAPHGTPIYAARDGVVDFAGWKGGYGRVVFLDHGDGIVTVYGHASSLSVQSGQQVKKGQMIARVGCTGRCTGSHLHFEVRVNGRAVNPLPYLR